MHNRPVDTVTLCSPSYYHGRTTYTFRHTSVSIRVRVADAPGGMWSRRVKPRRREKARTLLAAEEPAALRHSASPEELAALRLPPLSNPLLSLRTTLLLFVPGGPFIDRHDE